VLPLSLPQLSPRQRHLVASTWNFRASAERSALLRFQRLLIELRQTGAPAVVVEGVEQAIDDESRHIGLCDQLARLFGRVDAPSGPTPHGPIGPPSASIRERLLYEMVAFCCVTETINAAMLVAVQRRVQAPNVKEVVQAILKDEVNHSRIGWAYLQWARNEGRADWLADWLQPMFEGAGVEEIYAPDSGERDGPLMAAYGELSLRDRTSIFRAANRDVVLPGMERVGFRTDECERWLATFEAPIPDQ
jgi:hypothetical protein